jgi:hypothetical protein
LIFLLIPASKAKERAMDTTIKYDIEVIKEEARQLVKKGLVNRQQPIYALCPYIRDRDWACFEVELEKNEFLLRDRVIDLLGCESWEED